MNEKKKRKKKEKKDKKRKKRKGEIIRRFMNITNRKDSEALSTLQAVLT